MSAATPVFQASSFLLAPLMLGVINRVKAMVAGRSGPPLLQPYYDIWKLLQKGAVYSRTATWVFRAGPAIGLAAVATAMLLFPIGFAAAPMGFAGDHVVFAGLFALMRFFTVLAALDTGSSFEGMGASREVTFSALAEPALMLVLATLVLVTGSISLSGALGAGLRDAWSGGTGPALVLIMGALFLLLLAENARIPVDDPNTHLELTMVHEVMVLDHSGPDLAYITYGTALKLWLFASLLVGIAAPVSGGAAAEGAVFLVGMLAVAVAVGIVESSRARLKMAQVSQLVIFAAALGAAGMMLAALAR
jgi:formate hydrogenlyase subunit 4